MKKLTLENYKKDIYYPRVVRAITAILSRSDVVSPAEVLMQMGNLSKKNYEAWRKGQVPYLERVIEGSLSKADRILRLIGFHVHNLNMVPTQTIYQQWGKAKGGVLRFSKSGIKKIEDAYSRHYRWNGSQEKKREVIEKAISEQQAGAEADNIAVSRECLSSAEEGWLGGRPMLLSFITGKGFGRR